MKATILSNKRGINVQHNSQYLLKIDDEKYNSRSEATKIIGKKAIYKTSSGKEIIGKFISTHGNKGVLKVRFEKGLPGTAISEKVDVK